MLSVTVKITGDREIINKLRRLDAGLLNFSSAMKDIGDEAKNYFKGQVFASEGAEIGVPWPALAASTIAYKRRHSLNPTLMLVRGGKNSEHMRDSFEVTSSAKSVTISNSASYFKYHQSSAPHHRIPYRPMMAINDQITNMVRNILQADIARKIEAA